MEYEIEVIRHDNTFCRYSVGSYRQLFAKVSKILAEMIDPCDELGDKPKPRRITINNTNALLTKNLKSKDVENE